MPDGDVNLALEAVKLVQTWSSWQVTVALAIASLGVASLPREKDTLEKTVLGTAIVLLGASALFASWILMALPSIVQRISSNSSVLDMNVAASGRIGEGIELEFLIGAQHAFFALALLLLAFRALLTLRTKNTHG